MGDARLNRHDRFPGADLAGDIDELLPVGHAFAVDHDHTGVLIIAPGLQQVDLAHICLVAQADELGEAQSSSQGDVQHCRAQRARLRHEGHRAAGRGAGGKGGVQRGEGVDHTQTVWSYQADAKLPGDSDQLQFPLQTFPAGFPETRTDHNGSRDALLSASTQGFRDKRVGNHDHSQVDGVGDVQHAGISRVPQDLAGSQVDRVNPAALGITSIHQVLEHRIA